jgi:hypothetical protein
MALLRETPGEMLRFDAVGKNLRHEAVSEMLLLRGSRACRLPNRLRATGARLASRRRHCCVTLQTQYSGAF